MRDQGGMVEVERDLRWRERPWFSRKWDENERNETR